MHPCGARIDFAFLQLRPSQPPHEHLNGRVEYQIPRCIGARIVLLEMAESHARLYCTQDGITLARTSKYHQLSGDGIQLFTNRECIRSPPFFTDAQRKRMPASDPRPNAPLNNDLSDER